MLRRRFLIDTLLPLVLFVFNGMQSGAIANEIECTGPASCGPSACDCTCLCCRESLFDDSLFLRSALAERGITFSISATQFYQGVTSGGREQTDDYGGKIDYFAVVDGGKLGVMEGFFMNLHAETRFGTSVNDNDGLLAPANLAMNFPDANSDITSITGLKLTQALSESFALYMGKINTLDEYPIRFVGGPGLGGFMNTSLVFNPIMARTVPYSAIGVGAAVLSEGEPLFTLTAFDPEERATSGLEDPYARGVVIVPDLSLRISPFGRPGVYNFGGTYSTAEYTSVDPSA